MTWLRLLETVVTAQFYKNLVILDLDSLDSVFDLNFNAIELNV